MFKLVLEKAEEPKIKFPVSSGSLKRQESPRETSISALLTMPKLLTVWITTNGKILKEMGITDHLPCLLRYLYADQEVTVRSEHITDWFQIGKGIHHLGCILSPCLLNLHSEYIMRNAELDETQAGIKIDGEIAIISDMQMTPLLWQKVKKNLLMKSLVKRLLMEVKEESESVVLNLNIQKTKIMASSPITSW